MASVSGAVGAAAASTTKARRLCSDTPPGWASTAYVTSGAGTLISAAMSALIERAGNTGKPVANVGGPTPVEARATLTGSTVKEACRSLPLVTGRTVSLKFRKGRR